MLFIYIFNVINLSYSLILLKKAQCISHNAHWKSMPKNFCSLKESISISISNSNMSIVANELSIFLRIWSTFSSLISFIVICRTFYELFDYDLHSRYSIIFFRAIYLIVLCFVFCGKISLMYLVITILF